MVTILKKTGYSITDCRKEDMKSVLSTLEILNQANINIVQIIDNLRHL